MNWFKNKDDPTVNKLLFDSNLAMTRLFIYSTAKQQETRQEPFGSSGEKAAADTAVVVLQEIPAAELLDVVVKVTLPIGW
ncbi:unnamed protein product [Sphagnum jensenii]|uniref:Uncharacterized protein n=1 Tax=Sphagnum jensenii TaxID=128206 RepID=A0ABP1BPI6_9BRYO